LFSLSYSLSFFISRRERREKSEKKRKKESEEAQELLTSFLSSSSPSRTLSL